VAEAVQASAEAGEEALLESSRGAAADVADAAPARRGEAAEASPSHDGLSAGAPEAAGEAAKANVAMVGFALGGGGSAPTEHLPHVGRFRWKRGRGV